MVELAVNRHIKAVAVLLIWLWMPCMLCLPVQAGDRFIVVQSTTSIQNAGLFDYILPFFEAKTGIEVRVVAVGTGQAIANGMNGDGDVLLIHAKHAEERFVAEGFGVKRFDVMYNDFVIVGPHDDPAGITGFDDAAMAFARLAKNEAVFISRGDDSGTHKKEMTLWREAGIDPTGSSGRWYRETGAGMGASLNVAIGMNGYIMTDRATWIAFANKAGFQIHAEGDHRLFNQYGIILVNPAKYPHIKARDGQILIDWILSAEGQAVINAYHVNGRQLFFANAR